MNANYNSNLLLQQQQQQHLHQNPQQGGQQSQQQPQSSLQPDQSMNQNNMDPGRLPQWAQMRYGQNPAADMNHSKLAAEMMKRDQFSRHQSQQSFAATGATGLGMQQPQNGANLLGGNSQQQPFHDQHQSNLTQQAHLPQAFPNMGVMPNGNSNAAASASLQGRNPSGGFPGSQAARPLDMMGMAQGQQNTSVNANKFSQLQPSQLALRDSQQMQFPQGLQGSPADMFPGRSSPHPGNNMQPSLGQNGQLPHGFIGAMPGGARPQTLDFSQRMQLVQFTIQQLEGRQANLMAQVANVRGNANAEAQINQSLNEIRAEVAKKKDLLNRMTTAWKQQMGQHPSNGGQSNNQWGSHPNMGQAFDPNGQARPPSMGLLPNQPTHAMQPSPNLSQVSAQANPLLNSGLIPPRTIPTPQLPPQSVPPHINGPMSFTKANPSLPKGSVGSQSSVGMQVGNAMTHVASPLGLDKAHFDNHFRTFLGKRGGLIDPRLRVLENRQLDLHALHVQVMQEGGFSKIEGNDNLWSIIAARLGHVQFPGSGTEPPRSGPGVAQVMQHLYKEYIAPFETWYIAMMQEIKKHQANASLQAALSTTRHSLQQLLQMVTLSPSELQSQGVDENTMQIVETYKGTLQRLVQEQRVFSDGVRNNAAQNNGHGDQSNAMGHRLMGPSPSFGPGSSQPTPQQNLLSITGRQQLQHHIMQQQQGGQQLQSMIANGVDAMGARMPGQQMPSSFPLGGTNMQNFAQKPSLSPAQADAVQLVEQFKNEYAMSTYSNTSLEVPAEQQGDYAQLLERLYRQSVEMERHLGSMALILKDVDEQSLKRLVNILCAVKQQRTSLSSPSGPRYIVSLGQLKAMGEELNRIHSVFSNSIQDLKKQRLQQPPQMVNHLMAPPVVKQEMPSQSGRSVHSRQPSEVSPQQSQPSQPPSQPPLNPNQGLRPPATASLQPPKRKPPQTPGGSAVASSPSPAPAASAPTPVANTPTPTATASSPPATKSPKTKVSAKSKAANAKQRRPSKIVQPVMAVPAVEEMKPTHPATSVTAGKRPREDDSTPNSGGESSEVANEGSPPKRVKTEWECQPSETQRKQYEVVSNTKTDEETAAIFDQITKLIKTEGQPSLITTGISETLDMLLKGYGPVPDAMDGYSVGAGVESSSSREPDAAPTLGDPFDEFFDFSFGTVEDEESKTPDLVSSSSTNPSPESNHDAEPGHHLHSSASSSTVDIQTEDPLRLGTWKEIDGGEAAYFQTTEWKYDSPMTSYDQPWAIFNS